jgi:NAD(P)-dependent dehydrogenase (short-subunit alcohol dehydrogenase family)
VGSATGRVLASDGYAVVLADIDYDAAATAAAEIARDTASARVSAIEADVSSQLSAVALVKRAVSEFGRVDVVVNNAGVVGSQPLGTVSLDQWDSLLAVNLKGPMLLCQAALPYWISQGTGGAIVNIASRSWLSGAPPAYASSKAGLIGLTRSLAIELGQYGITANAIAPSFMRTAMTMTGLTARQIEEREASYVALTPIGRVVRPEDIAYAVAFLASRRAAAITGEVLHVCGGSQLPHAPRMPSP